jgi:hypothetical protein
MIIGICGFQGAGKDTMANILIEKYGFIKFSFANALKDIISILFCWPRELIEGDTNESRLWRETVDEWWSKKLNIPELTPRMIMQKIGTDLFRKYFNEDIWVNIIEKKIKDAGILQNIVITDCRFPNEIKLLRELGGKIIHIYRHLPLWFDNYILGEFCSESKFLHPSEKEWIREKFDYTIDNKESISDLEVKVDEYMKRRFIKN